MAYLKLHNKNIIIAVGIFVVIVLFTTHLLPSSSPPPLPPLPGTYLYYNDIEYNTPNGKLFGAVNHADARFAPSPDPDHGPSIQETKDSLRWLLESYAAKTRELGAETWMAHGTLLGWWWNQRLLPWDTDLDVQMSYATLQQLSSEWNGTTFDVAVTSPPRSSTSDTAATVTRRYLLDVNAHFQLITKADVANRIDARWIDVANGKYLDITAVHLPSERDADGHRVDPDGKLWCKDGHRYDHADLYPLQDSTLEGVPVKVPHEARKVLVDEYKLRSVTRPNHHWHNFNDKTMLWEPE